MSCIKNYHKILVVIASEDVTNVNERWTSLEFYYEKAAGKKKNHKFLRVQVSQIINMTSKP